VGSTTTTTSFCLLLSVCRCAVPFTFTFTPQASCLCSPLGSLRPPWFGPTEICLDMAGLGR
jgi:hypothetical protein